MSESPAVTHDDERNNQPWTHRYVWGNNAVRANARGLRCRILASGSLRTVLIKLENGHLMTTDRYAVRRLETP